jgi:hypothetical protein
MRRTGLSKARVFRSLLLLIAGVFITATASFANHEHTTKPFSGVKVNGGRATHTKAGNRHVLTLSDDFKIPDSPAPHWQVVDSRGNVYLLQRLVIKDDKFHKQITAPAYVRDIARVQIWCSWAEVLLGDAPFSDPVR